jgi:hypothetical protein
MDSFEIVSIYRGGREREENLKLFFQTIKHDKHKIFKQLFSRINEFFIHFIHEIALCACYRLKNSQNAFLSLEFIA